MKRFHRGTIAAAAAVVAVGLTLAGCSDSSSLSGSGGSSESIVVGSANFVENETLAYVYGEALAGQGVKVSYKVNIGQRTAYIPALEKGEVNLIPEYAGSILSYFDKSANQKSSSEVEAALTKSLPKGLAITDFAEATDADTLTVTPEFAKAHNLSSIGDLAGVGPINMGATANFSVRPDGIDGLKSVYGVSNITVVPISDGGGPATLKALLDNTVQVADIYTTTPSIAANKLVVLKDPKNLFASQQVVPIGTSSKLTSKVKAELNKVSAKLTTDDLLAMNERTQGDEKADAKTVASDWLKKNGLIK